MAVELPYDLTNGTVADAAQVQANFDALAAAIVNDVVEVDSSGKVLTAEDDGTVFSNASAGGLVTYTLPAGVPALKFGFGVVDSDGVKVQAAGGQTIYLGASASSAGGYVQSTTVGSFLLLIAMDASTWLAMSYTGSWTEA